MHQSSTNGGWVEISSNWIDLDLYTGPDELYRSWIDNNYNGKFSLAIYESKGVSDCMKATEEKWQIENFFAEDNGSYRYLNDKLASTLFGGNSDVGLYVVLKSDYEIVACCTLEYV